jgi:hypothetical protein
MARKNQAAHAAIQAAQAAVSASDAAMEEDEDGEEKPTVRLGPMFHSEEIGEKTHTRTRVCRIEPIDEGRVGDLPPDGGEAEIFRRWGGGGFDCSAIGSNGQVIARRTIRIAGEPRFDNNLGRLKYKEWKDQNFPEDPPVMMDGGGTPIDPVALEEAWHNREIARIRAEAEVAVAKAKAEADSFLARAKAEAEASISKARQERAEQEGIDERRRRKEREERRAEREEIEAREDQRRKNEREERRLDREEASAREDARHRADLELRREELQHKQDPMQMLHVAMKLVGDIRGDQGGSDDPVTAAINNIGPIMDKAQQMYMTSKIGNPGPGQPGRPAAQNGFDPARGDIALVGEVAQKFQRAIRALEKAGSTPRRLMKAADALATARPTNAQPAQPAQPPRMPPAPPAPGLPPKPRTPTNGVKPPLQSVPQAPPEPKPEAPAPEPAKA